MEVLAFAVCSAVTWFVAYKFGFRRGLDRGKIKGFHDGYEVGSREGYIH
jgi:hypothetical protein